MVITGATGFIGTALRRALASQYRLVVLTRSTADVRSAQADSAQDQEVEWRSCDLFSLLELEQRLQNADYAVYLADSMLPSSRLIQGTHVDMDLIMADNFARAAQFCGLKHIFYLSSLLPDAEGRPGHPTRRSEVEDTLGSGATPLTVLRAGLIVGTGGSSLNTLATLVRRLPFIVLPAWAKTPVQPIAIADVVKAVQLCLRAPSNSGGCYDIGGPDVVTFRELLERIATTSGRKRVMLVVPFQIPFLTLTWRLMLRRASRYIAGPRDEFTARPLVATANPVQAALAPGATPLATALRESLDADGRLHPNPRGSLRPVDDRVIREARRVRSIQRLPLPAGWTARQVTTEYYRWLPGAIGPLLRCEIAAEGPVRLYLVFTRLLLIEFTPAPPRSSENRQLLYITGGALARTKDNLRGRIEFREILNRRCLLVAIHDYTPTLPWGIYRFTQALVHLWVTRRFGRHLGRIKSSGGLPNEALR